MNTIRKEKRKVLEWHSFTLHSPLSTLHCPKGFTLVELLTVIVIISMLAAISLVALNGSYTEAKIAKTRGTIAKLDAAIQQIFEGYEEKFDAISPTDAQVSAAITALGLTPADYSSVKARLKLHFIWDTMRMEMPTHWAEVRNPNNSYSRVEPIAYGGQAVQAPEVFQYYYNVSPRAGDPDGNGPAELLYLIIANLNPEALENFHGSEIGDADNNGLLEFVDGWGRPIFFIRAAPGFTGTDKQPDVVTNAGWLLGVAGNNDTTWTSLLGGTSMLDIPDSTWTGLGAFRWAVENAAPDPFDPGGVVNRSWFLYPVIVSAGPDGLFSTRWGRPDGGVLAVPTDASHVNPFNYPSGIPDVASGQSVLYHYDNIHNHRSAGGF